MLGMAAMVLALLLDVNQTLSLAVGLLAASAVQKIVSRHKRGYIIHFLYAGGARKVLKGFPAYGRYRN